MKNLTIIAKKIRQSILETLYEEQLCHLGSCMSVVEILIYLYFVALKKNDVFVSSKGHCAVALYHILAEKGYFSKENIKEYLQTETLISHKVPGVVFSGGSLGQGLSVACGMALADRKRKVYCLLGDGELDEGNVWEAAMFGSHHKLNNLIVLIDRNGLQALGKTEDILKLEPLKKKWQAFNWDVLKINGHNFDHLWYISEQVNKKPLCVICHTIKAKGIKLYENKVESHYRNLTKEENEKAIYKLTH